MGIFSKKKNEIIEKRDTEIYSGHNEGEEKYIPKGIEFMLNRNPSEPTAISAFYSGVEMISNSIAGIPIFVKDVNTKEIVKHSFVDAINGASLSKFMFIKMIIWDIYLSGQAFVYIRRSGRDIKELVYLRPTDVQVNVISTDTFPRKVIYKISRMGDLNVEPINMIHLYKNSLDGITGKGVPFFAKRILDIASNTDSTALDFFKAGANVNGILKSSKFMDTEQKEEAYQAWVSSFKDKVHGGNIAILGNDWTYEQVGMNNQDAEMLASREFNVLEVCRYLNISPALLGIKTATAYGNLEQAQLDFILHTLLPLINMLQDEFNRKIFLKDERNKYFIDFDEDKIMFSDKTSTGNYYSSLVKNGIISINEAREALGYVKKDDPGCSDLIIPYTNINNNKVTGNGEEGDEKEEENDSKSDGHKV